MQDLAIEIYMGQDSSWTFLCHSSACLCLHLLYVHFALRPFCMTMLSSLTAQLLCNIHAYTELTNMLFTLRQMQKIRLLTAAPEINFCAEKQLCAGCCNHNHSSAREGREKALITGLCVLIGLPSKNILPPWDLPKQILCRTELYFCIEEVTFDKYFLLDCELRLSRFLYWHFELCSRSWSNKLFKRWRWQLHLPENKLPQTY